MFDVGLLPTMLLYLDPGTGSLLFSVVMGFATAAFFVLKGVFYKNRVRLLKLMGKQLVNASEHHHRIVIYSEGRQYAGTFKPIIAELVSRGIECLFLSSDAEDPLLVSDSSLVETKHIGNGYTAWGYLNTLTADVCVMTTPGLDVFQIKRSKNVGHYAHVIHSPTDKAFNRPYSFDYFDSVFICGPHQQQTIRYLETLRKTAPKQLFMAGCVYYDEFVKTYRSMAENSTPANELRVLIAPTWGKNGLLTRYGVQIIKPLVEAGLHVVVRPHPQCCISESELLAQIKTETQHYANLMWDDAASPLEAMVNSDVLISDISGIVFDYSFVTEKPVITLDFVPEKRGFEANDLPYDPWELSVLDIVGRKIKEPEIKQLEEIVRTEFANRLRIDQIRELRDIYVVNFGCTAGRVADELERLLSHRTETDAAAGTAKPKRKLS